MEISDYEKDQSLFQKLIEEQDSTEVLINGPHEIWREQNGHLRKTDLTFSNQESLMKILRSMIHSSGRSIDAKNPFCNISLADGKRIHVVISPVTNRGILVSIRKPRPKIWHLEDLMTLGFLTGVQKNFLINCVEQKKNIFISGSTSSGKTSLLSALANIVDVKERILALEDVREIRTTHPHCISLETRIANQEGFGEISLERLLVESLRMRPDRIFLGECRSQEALNLLFSLNTGHRGSMATIHANNPRDALRRLEALALSAEKNFSETLIQKLICGCVDVVVHLGKDNGRRSIQSIVEVKGYEEKNYLLRNAPSA